MVVTNSTYSTYIHRLIRLLLVAVFSLLCLVQAKAQLWNFGVEGGCIVNRVAHHGGDVTMNGLNGFRVGVLANCRFDNNLMVEEGVYYKRIGVEEVNMSAISNHESMLVQHIDYITASLLVGYHISLTYNASLVPQVGFYAGMGAHNKTERFVTTSQYNSGTGFSANDTPVINPSSSYDAGIQAALAFEYRRFRAKAYYECQLNKLLTRSGNNNLRLHSFGFSIAFFLRDQGY